VLKLKTTYNYIKYLIPTCSTMFLFINYCSNMFWPHFVATFREHMVYLMCAA